MKMQKVLAWLVCVFCLVALGISASAESAAPNTAFERVGITITESAQVTRNPDGSYATCMTEGQTELVLTGTYDGNSKLMVILNSVGGDLLGCAVEKNEDGIWVCTIPTVALYKDSVNKFVILYYDDFDNDAVCYIGIDTVCELELDIVYENSGVISGTTESGAEVKLAWGDEEFITTADEKGRFTFAMDVSADDAVEGCYVEVTDVYGNTANQEVVVVDVDISVFAKAITNTDSAHVVMNAIPDSHVQIMLDGEAWGDLVHIDESGSGSAIIYGLEHGCNYNLTAVYAGDFADFDVVSKPVQIAVDIYGPEIKADNIVIDEESRSINVHMEEECTLMFTEETTGYTELMTVVPGRNVVSFEGLIQAHELVAGMKIAFTAYDEYGNASKESLVYDVQLPVSDMLFIAGMATEGNHVNAMEKAKAVGQVYVQSKAYTMDAYIYGYESDMAQKMEAPSYTMKLNSAPLKAFKSDKGAKMPAFIPINLVFDAEELPMDYSYELVFHVNDENGERLYSYNRLSLGFVLEKDAEWLMHRLILMALLLICLMIVLGIYVRISRRRRNLKRNIGAVRRGRRAGKRGGVWA